MARNIPLGSKTWAGALGQGLSQGIESATPNILNFLAQNKAYNIAAQHYKTLNPQLTDAEAQAIVRQSPQIQAAAFGWSGNQPQQAQQQMQQPQMMQQQVPQQPQFTPQQMMQVETAQKQLSGLQSLQQANAVQQLRQQGNAGFAEQKLLRRLPPAAKAKMGMGLFPQEQEQPMTFQRFPQQPAPQQMAPQVPQQMPQQAPITPQGPSLGEYISGNLKKGGAKSQEAINKEDQQFGLALDKAIDSGKKIERDLDRIDELVNKDIDKKKIQWGLIASKVPISQLNNETKLISNLFSDILVKQSTAAGQGRGSDLLRKMVTESKFSLEQGPQIWKEISERLREDIDYDKKLYKERHNILKEYGGKPPAELAYLTRERVANEIQQESAHKQSLQNWAKGDEINDLPANDTPEAKAIEGRALESKYGPVIYIGGKQYPAVKKNGKWSRK